MNLTHHNIPPESWLEIESVIEQFESQWIDNGRADINAFARRVPADYVQAALTELIRCDLEFQWRNGHAIELADYLIDFPQLAEWPEAMSAVAFEEYRQKTQFGEQTSPEEYRTKYQVDTSGWPVWIARTGKSTRAGTPTTLNTHRFPREGTRFLDFQIVAELGRGALGRVYLARQGDLANRFVALKVTTEKTEESQQLAQLQHSNIVPVYSVHEHNGLYAICMPFLGLITLRDVLTGSATKPNNSSVIDRHLISTIAAKRQSTLVDSIRQRSGHQYNSQDLSTADDAQRYEHLQTLSGIQLATFLAANIASGLAYAHEHDIIHGDLKPENILVSDDGLPLILDFHLSRSSVRAEREPSIIGGTLPYLSEQHLKAINGHGTVDSRCDIYSLGVILFEMLAGQRPFPDHVASENDLIERMIRDRQSAPELRRLVPSINPDLLSIVDKSLAPDPANRYATAREMETDLQRHLDHLPLKYAANRSIVERGRKFLRRNPHLKRSSTVVAAAVLVIAVVATLLWFRTSQLQRMRSIENSREFAGEVFQARLRLATQHDSTEPIRNAIQHADSILEKHDASDVAEYKSSNRLDSLPQELRENEINNLALLNFWLAEACLELSQRELELSRKQHFVDRANNYNTQAIELLGSARQGLNLQAATIAELLGESDRAQQLMESFQFAEPVDSADQVLSASFHIRQGNYEKASQLLEMVLQTDPLDYSTWLLLGNAHAGLRQYPDAIACYTICLGLDSDSGLGWWHRGRARLEQGNFQGAIADFDEAIKRSPDDPSIVANRGLAYRNLGMWQKSESDLTAAIEMGHPHSRLYFLRGRIRQYLGKHDAAARDHQTGLELTPSDEISWITRGVEYLKQGDVDQALHDFRAAYELNPKSSVALQNIASIQAERLGKTSEAIETMSKLIALHPQDPQAIATRGVLYARLDDRENALKDAAAAMTIQQDADTLYRVSGIHALLSAENPQDAQAAESLVARATWLNPALVDRYIHEDPDLKSVRDREGFQEIEHLISRLAERSTMSTEEK